MAEINDGDTIPTSEISMKSYTPVNFVSGQSKTLVRVNGNYSPFFAGSETQVTNEGVIGTQSGYEILASSRVAYEPLTFSIREHDKTPPPFVYNYYIHYNFGVGLYYKVADSPFAFVNGAANIDYEGYVLANLGLNTITVPSATVSFLGDFIVGGVALVYNLTLVTFPGGSYVDTKRVSGVASGSMVDKALADLGTTRWSGDFSYSSGATPPWVPLMANDGSVSAPVGQIRLSSDLTGSGIVTPLLIATLPIPSVRKP